MANLEYFKVRRIELDGSATMSVTDESFVSVLCLDGEAKIATSIGTYSISKGNSYFLPAGTGEFKLDGKAMLTVSEVH